MKVQFITLAPNKWQGQWMNRQQLFSRLGKQFPVLYSTGPMCLWQRQSPEFSKLKLTSQVIDDNYVKVLTPSIFSVRIPKLKILDRIANKIFGTSLIKHTKPNTPIVLYLFHPSYYHFARYIKHDYLVFHAYDDYSKQGSYSKELKSSDLELAQQADLLIVSSNSIKKRYQKLCHRDDILFVPNGVDFKFFSQKPNIEPVDLASIPSPRVSYVGSINSKIDLDLLLKLAIHFPLVSFVMVGHIANLDKNQLVLFNALSKKENVYFLGNKAVNEISAYMHYADINIMLYSVSEKIWASSGYPLKMHEYLAVGKPVISCNIEAVREFSGVIKIAQSTEEWTTYIEEILNQKDSDEMLYKRQCVAKANTWDQRVESISKGIAQLLLDEDKA